MSDSAQSRMWDPQRPAALAPLLAHRRWWRYRYPFPHLRAVNVFRPAVYAELEDAFLSWLKATDGGTVLAGHDLRGTTLSSEVEGPLRLFASPGWHRLIARACSVKATGHVNLGLHHHRPGSLPGFPHTDLNPGWFPEPVPDGPDRPGNPDAIVLAAPGRVNYVSGQVSDASARPVKVIRAVAVIFYLANPMWEAEHRGKTGLYRNGGAGAQPVTSIPPHSNSLLAFECTPWSFHGFLGGGCVPRNSVVQWLHQSADAATDRWGAGQIRNYGART